MTFIADLHIHSRFSRATAKNLDFENLYIAARRKGITLLGTGDFTHPAWFAEIREKLVPAEPGLFKLNDAIEKKCEAQIPFKNQFPVRFMLNGEISSIYKKSGATRKIHNLVFLPDLESTARFAARLDRIGNIVSDGRPILGLDARDLLEILLECSDEGFLIPAHIWTPWFSLFGAKSGFDAMEECFADLTPHIFAVETGLSSDPPMNWRVKGIDGLTLVSNSDAHSPANLGREANLLNTDLSYPAVKHAIKTGDPEKFIGTLEFFPEEGKYHQDGHRKCDVSLNPRESIDHGNLCPVCNKPLTMGVLHRVEELATRKDGDGPENRHPFYSLIPLSEILSEIEGVGCKSKKVAAAYERVLERLGPELPLLYALPTAAVREAGMGLLAEAIERMRAGRVHINAGYDGEYGRIRVFSPQEIDALAGQKSLFQMPQKALSAEACAASANPSPKSPRKPVKPAAAAQTAQIHPVPARDLLAGLNPDQARAVTHEQGPLLIVAGPGTGKTRTLTHRIAWLIREKKIAAESILAITFTNRAAREMAQRLSDLLGKDPVLPLTATFHAFCLRFLKEQAPESFTLIDENTRLSVMGAAMARAKKNGITVRGSAEAAGALISAARQQLLLPGDELAPISKDMPASSISAVYQIYREMMDAQKACDFDDLIARTVEILQTDQTVRAEWQNRFPYVFVDEYQDLNLPQYRIIQALVNHSADLCVIGDPDQSIYGFRGSDVAFFQRFLLDFPAARRVRLTRNYRSTDTILEASGQIMENHSLNSAHARVYSGISGLPHITILTAQTEKAEAVAVGKMIEQMIGGTGFDFTDFGKSSGTGWEGNRAFSDFTVLYRTRAQGEIFGEMFEKAGIPFQLASRQNLFERKGVAEALAWLKMMERCAAWTDLDRINACLASPFSPGEMEVIRNRGYRDQLPAHTLLSRDEPIAHPALTPAGNSLLAGLTHRMADLRRKTASLTASRKLAFMAEQPEIRPLFANDSQISEAFKRVIAMAEPFGQNTRDFIETITLENDPDVIETGAEKVCLMTLHAAKGLEFPVVFITGCEDGLIPFLRAGKASYTDAEEERRLFYVGMTRAKEALYLCWSNTRMIHGRTGTRTRSPFLDDIEKQLLKQKRREHPPRKKGPVQMTLFSGTGKT